MNLEPGFLTKDTKNASGANNRPTNFLTSLTNSQLLTLQIVKMYDIPPIANRTFETKKKLHQNYIEQNILSVIIVYLQAELFPKQISNSGKFLSLMMSFQSPSGIFMGSKMRWLEVRGGFRQENIRNYRAICQMSRNPGACF